MKLNNMERLTREQATVIQVITGCVLMNPRDFVLAVEEVLGRKTLSTEWSNIHFIQELQDRFYPDFLRLVYNPQTVAPGNQVIVPADFKDGSH